MVLPRFSDYEIETQFLEFLRQNNIYPTGQFSLVMNGQIQRYKLDGDKSGEYSGAYCVFTDNLPAGWAQDWHDGHSIKWHYDISGLTQEQKDYFNSPEYKKKTEAEQKKRDEEKKQRQKIAAENARIRLETLPDAPEDHKYLVRKHVFPYGVKLDNDNRLAVPLRDIDGNIKSLQWITPDKGKFFFPDTSTDGLFWSIGLDLLDDEPNAPILLGEGFATMAKIYELTNLPCVAALSCYALNTIAHALKSKFSSSSIIVMADNDKATEIKRGFNPGIAHAQKLVDTGLAVSIIAPEFDNPDNGSDWDDFAILHGDVKTYLLLKDKIEYALIPPHIKPIRDKTTIINAQALRTKVFPPLKWAVDGFLPAGLSILAGGPKIGKSILALHLAIGVAIGGCVLGSIFVQQGGVLYLALEDNPRRLQERINCSSIVEENTDLSELELITEIPRQHLGGLDFIKWWLTQHQNTRLVIIDTLQMFRKQLSGKGSMYAEDYEVISQIKKLADEYDVAVLILHHLKKGMEGDWLSEISGSQGISGAADTIFSLKRERNSVMGTLHRTGRDVEEKDFIMKLDGYGWVLQGEADEFTTPEWKRQILDFLKDNPTVSPMLLAGAVPISLDAAQKNLQRLAKEGLIKKVGHGTYALSQ